jgi:hypothetical protein
MRCGVRGRPARLGYARQNGGVGGDTMRGEVDGRESSENNRHARRKEGISIGTAARATGAAAYRTADVAVNTSPLQEDEFASSQSHGVHGAG